MKKYLISSLGLSLSIATFANQDQQKINDRLNDQRVQTEATVTAVPQPTVNKPQKNIVKKEDNHTISMSSEELVHHPDLVLRALYSAVHYGNADSTEILFPIYQKLPETAKDPILTLWSQAILAKQQQNYSESIRLFRKTLAALPDINVRFQLAVTLFENNELEAAEDQFQKLRAEPDENAQKISEQYLQAIQHRDRWAFSGGLTYLNDPNINNAPKSGTTYGRWSAPKSESAQGVGFNFNIGKKWSWGNGFFNSLYLDTDGKYYWNNKKYNEFTTRGKVGLGFQNSKYSIEVLPFIEQVLYANGTSGSQTLKRFSKTGGATVEFIQWLSPQWLLTSNYEYGEQRYISRKHLNGNYHFVSAGLRFLASSKQYWFANINYNRTSTRDADDSFFRRGITFGWGQEWGKGLSTRLSMSLAQKRYKGPMPIFNITQRNREYGLQASVWHRAIHFLGITPQLTYSFNKTKSNHAFYTYDKHRVFVNFSKSF
ncbi:hypothetical protein A6B43_02655 [Vespertiliibacter pulmonis]|uniref:Uncharacterized protein DUF560 n=1 Tax=Vespertiliibacter pulmonis TaxID=1443036 RepID=A0A3N4VDV6_9PAST|nr:porin family protein [Vespertiliibacter pulmonis]QLB20510.1 hypothetical protein A6B43_02655 [Vespertiliibacter pulmonis]RPE80818.1 uncharacterized protein DUF560 [Vespertiliibacter pulmonis]